MCHGIKQWEIIKKDSEYPIMSLEAISIAYAIGAHEIREVATIYILREYLHT